MGGRSKSFVGNTAWSLVLQVVNVISGFLVPRVIIGTYGSEVNGLVNSLAQIMGYIALVEAGISAAAIFALYKPLAEGDMLAVSSIVTSAKRFYYKSGVVFTLLIIALAFLCPAIVDVGSISNSQIIAIVLFLGATGILDFFTLAKYRVLLTADQRNWVIQIASVVYKLLYIVVIIGMCSVVAPIEFVYGVAIVPILIRTAILVVYAKKQYPDVDYRKKGVTYRLDQQWDAFYLQVLGVVQNGFPILVATILLNDLSAVSVFSMYILIATSVQSVCLSLSGGTQASFGDVIAKGEKDVLKTTFKEFQTISYTINAIVSAVALVVILPFMGVYMEGVTDIDYVVPSLGILSIVNIFLYHLKSPQGLLVIAAGRYRETRLQTSMQTVILIVGSIVGGVVFGGPGILLGSCVSNLYRCVDLMLYIPRCVTGTSPLDTLKRMLLACVKLALSVAPFAFIRVTCGGWAEIAILILVVGIWSTLISLLITILFERDEYRGLVARVRGLFSR